MLRDSSTIPKRTHHNKHEINDTLSSLKGLYTQHTLAPQRNKKSITHQHLHEKTSVLHDSEPIPDLLSFSGHEWTPPNNTTHYKGPWGGLGNLLYLLLDWLFIELIKICLLLMYTAHDDTRDRPRAWLLLQSVHHYKAQQPHYPHSARYLEGEYHAVLPFEATAPWSWYMLIVTPQASWEINLNIWSKSSTLVSWDISLIIWSKLSTGPLLRNNSASRRKLGKGNTGRLSNTHSQALYIRQTLLVMQASPSLDAPLPTDSAMHVGPEYPYAAAASVP